MLILECLLILICVLSKVPGKMWPSRNGMMAEEKGKVDVCNVSLSSRSAAQGWAPSSSVVPACLLNSKVYRGDR